MKSTRLIRSNLCLACLGILWLTSGCGLLNIPEVIKNPVAPPPPKRLLEDAENAKKSAGNTGFARLGKSQPQRPPVSDNPESEIPEIDELPDMNVRTADASAPEMKKQGKTGHSKLGKNKTPGWKKAGPGQTSGIEQVNFEEPALPLDPKRQNTDADSVLETQVAATVNGVPILVSEVLEPYSSYLTMVAKQRPEALKQERGVIISKVLDTYIDRQLLINALRTKLKEEQMESVESQLQKAFADELQKMYKQFKVSTPAELDAELTKQNTSLEAVKATFRNNRLAQQWMLFQTAPKSHFGRPELLEYYREHQADYEIPAKLKWQQISIPTAKYGSEKKALEVAKGLLDELEAGADFGELAKKHSSGATARDGGLWDWTRKGSLADQGLEKLLFELPVKDVTGPYQTKEGFEIVRVTERQDATRKSFESVQDEVRRKLSESQFKANSEKLLKDLRENASIEVVFNSGEVREARKASN